MEAKRGRGILRAYSDILQQAPPKTGFTEVQARGAGGFTRRRVSDASGVSGVVSHSTPVHIRLDRLKSRSKQKFTA